MVELSSKLDWKFISGNKVELIKFIGEIKEIGTKESATKEGRTKETATKKGGVKEKVSEKRVGFIWK